jgi:hypothetical protein
MEIGDGGACYGVGIGLRHDLRTRTVLNKRPHARAVEIQRAVHKWGWFIVTLETVGFAGTATV